MDIIKENKYEIDNVTYIVNGSYSKEGTVSDIIRALVEKKIKSQKEKLSYFTEDSECDTIQSE